MEKKANSLMERSGMRLTTGRMVLLAMLVGMNVVLGRFSIQITSEVRLSIVGFLPIALAGSLMGPMYGAMTGALGDFLNYLLFNHAYGAYFPGYTLTALLSGWWYGMALYRRDLSWKRAALCIAPVILLGEIGLNSVWTYMLYSKTFWVKLPLRVVTNVIECPLKMLLLMLVGRISERVPKSYLKL